MHKCNWPQLSLWLHLLNEQPYYTAPRNGARKFRITQHLQQQEDHNVSDEQEPDKEMIRILFYVFFGQENCLEDWWWCHLVAHTTEVGVLVDLLLQNSSRWHHPNWKTPPDDPKELFLWLTIGSPQLYCDIQQYYLVKCSITSPFCSSGRTCYWTGSVL